MGKRTKPPHTPGPWEVGGIVNGTVILGPVHSDVGMVLYHPKEGGNASVICCTTQVGRLTKEDAQNITILASALPFYEAWEAKQRGEFDWEERFERAGRVADGQTPLASVTALRAGGEI